MKFFSSAGRPRTGLANRLRRLLSLALLLALGLAAMVQAADGGELLTPAERQWLGDNQSRLVLAVETGYAPFVFLDAQGQPSGLAQDYLRLIEAKLGARFKQRRFSSLDAIFDRARAGEVHIVNAVTRTPARAEFLDFTEAFIAVPNVILVRKDRAAALREENLAGLTVSLVKSYAVTEYLSGKGLGLRPDLVADDLTALLNVSFGRSDAAVVDLATASYLISQKGIANLQVAGETTLKVRLAIATPRSEPVLHDILQKGLAAISEAERQEIQNRWISAAGPHFLADWRLWLAVGILLLAGLAAIAAVSIWNRLLRRQVAERTADLQAANARLQTNDRRLSAMFAMSQRVGELDEPALLQLGIEEAVRLTDSEIGYLHFVHEDQQNIELVTWSAGTLHHCSAVNDSHYPVSQAGVWADTLRFKRPVIHNDYQSLPERHGYPAGHAHLRRHLGVPVIEGDKVHMLIGVGNKAGPYDASDAAELQLIGKDLWSIAMRRRAEQALIAARDAAEAASRAKSTFLANMSHELRTPMNAIMGMTELALRSASEPKQRSQLDKVTQASRHLLHVINDILDISKIEAECLSLEQVGFTLDAVLDNLMSLVGHKAVDRGLEFRIDLAPGVSGLALIGDPLRLGQILLNLAGNAVKFTERGGIRVRVGLAEQHGTTAVLRFAVEDSGIGIADADRPRLFTAFEQADGSMTRKYGGTGLGLAISKRLVHLMGGEIGVDGAPGQGSTFWFTVRLGVDAGRSAPPTPKPAGATSEARLLARHAGARVLLAEDEPISQEVALGLLEEVGLRVEVADDGVQALAMAQRTRYDLVLMDMQMPGLSGVDATRAIRALAGYAGTPILAMTANAFDEDRQLCLAAGMNDHIPKPVDPEQLFDTLLKWLEPVEA